jgi:Tol biopolymer transport system component
MKKNRLLLFSLGIIFQTQILFAQTPSISSVTLFRDSAMCSVWSQSDPTLVAYSVLKPSGYYKITVANVGTGNQPVNEHCITCGNALLPGKTEGNPIFHPNGKYMALIAEKAVHPGSSSNSTPGIGQYSDIYAMTMDGTKVYQLTNTPNSVDSVCGLMFMFFSPDGKKICWTQMTKAVNAGDCLLPFGKLCFGGWDVKIADFVDDAVTGPSIKNIKTIRPGGVAAFNECYGWTPDGKKMLFASDYNQSWVWSDQIYSMDTLGNNITQLTTTGGAVGWPYCEHAFSSPDGKNIVWITNRENTVGASKGGDDWWIMKSDGTQQHRFTFFNDSTSSYWTGDTHINGFGCFSPAGNKFIGDVGGAQPIQTDPTMVSQVYIMNLNTSTAIAESNENLLADKFIVFPNPATDHLTIMLRDNNDKIYYSVYSLIGSKLYEGTFVGGSSVIDINNYPNGMYFIKLADGKSEVTKKFLVGK